MKINTFGTFFILLLTVALVAGCGNSQNVSQQNSNSTPSNSSSNSTSTPSENSTSAPKEEETKTTFPERQITLVITHASGSSVDLVARSIQPYVEKHLGVPVVIDNRPGAGGSIAASAVWEADPDGYTLLVTYIPSIHVGEVLQGEGYKSDEFEYIYNWYGGDSLTLAVKNDSPYETLDDIIAASEQKTLTFSGAGRGSTGHLASIVFSEIVGVNHTFIPFDAGSESIAAVLGGQVDGVLTTGTNVAKNEELRVIASFSEGRNPVLPDAPSFEELGYEGALVPVLGGAMGTPGIPEDVLEVLEEAFEKAANDPEYLKWAEEANYPLTQLNSEDYYSLSKTMYDMTVEYGDLLKD